MHTQKIVIHSVQFSSSIPNTYTSILIMAEDLQDLVNVYTWLQILICSQGGNAEPLKKNTSKTEKKKPHQKPKATKNLFLNQIIQAASFSRLWASFNMF